jgi:hypothetical protein
VKLSIVIAAAAWLIVASPRNVNAQSRPLATEDPETVGAGQVLLEGGLDYTQDTVYPASGLKGNLWRIGMFGLSIGVSSIAEIQIDGGVHDQFTIKSRFAAPLASMVDVSGDTTGDFPDATIGAKVRFVSETASRPAMAIRFWTRLPNEGNESGLGLDTTDFNFNLAIAKTVQSVRMAGNFGFGILGSPERADVQNDVLNYGFSVARAVRDGIEMVGEINGRLNTRSGTPPAGTESRSVMRLGARATRGPVRVDGAMLIGVTKYDPTWGFTAGVTWVFKAFTVQ